jgi:hypothetical protein
MRVEGCVARRVCLVVVMGVDAGLGSSANASVTFAIAATCRRCSLLCPCGAPILPGFRFRFTMLGERGTVDVERQKTVTNGVDTQNRIRNSL